MSKHIHIEFGDDGFDFDVNATVEETITAAGVLVAHAIVNVTEDEDDVAAESLFEAIEGMFNDALETSFEDLVSGAHEVG